MQKKQKITYIATSDGVEKAEKALRRLGYSSKSDFAKSIFLSRTTVTKFFQRQPLQLDSFKRICEALTFSNWRHFAETPIENEDFGQTEKRQVSSFLSEEVGAIPTRVREVMIVDEKTKIIKVVIKLEGDINSAPNIKIFAAILKEYSGDSITITDIQPGSIKLFVKGSQEDIERILFQINSGELKEINGFPIEDIQILSESAEDDKSSEQKWRLVEQIRSNSVERRDLGGADLSDADLSSANFSNANLINADLSDADLIGANLIRAKLSGANLSGANLSGANLSGANLSGANLSGADLSCANLSNANLVYADLSCANLSSANLRRANLSSANLSCANLSCADLSGANLVYADLSGANLSSDNLRRANLSNANLSNANLRSAYRRSAYLSRTNLSSADLSSAYLSKANLSKANLSKANLSKANLSSANLSGANLSSANLIETDLSSANVENAQFGNNSGILEQMKQDLIKRGAIFEDSPGDRSGILSSH